MFKPVKEPIKKIDMEKFAFERMDKAACVIQKGLDENRNERPDIFLKYKWMAGYFNESAIEFKHLNISLIAV